MKKTTIMAIATALSMAVAACGNSAIAAKADSASSETPAPTASASSDTDSTASGDVSAVVTPEPESDVLLGGWEINKGALVPDSNSDAVKVFNSAMKGITGCDYDLIAVLGSQSVAGTNYSYLCRETTVAPKAESRFAIVNIYEDLNGNAMLFGEKALPLMEADADSTDTTLLRLRTMLLRPRRPLLRPEPIPKRLRMKLLRHGNTIRIRQI